MSDQVARLRAVLDGTTKAPAMRGPHMGCVCETCCRGVLLGTLWPALLAVVEAAHVDVLPEGSDLDREPGWFERLTAAVDKHRAAEAALDAAIRAHLDGGES